jgi:hypothetical protein
MERFLKRLVIGTGANRFFRLTILDSWKYVPIVQYANINKILLFWKVSANAPQNYASLSNVYDLAKFVERDRLPGSIVECGVWRGVRCGSWLLSPRAKSRRRIWLFDSFEGMPEATTEDVGAEAKRLARCMMNGKLVPVGTNVASVDDVKTLFF